MRQSGEHRPGWRHSPLNPPVLRCKSAISDLGMGDGEFPPANRSPGLSFQNVLDLGSEDKVLW